MLTALHAKQHRLAQHYLKRLRTAHAVYSRGDDDNLIGLKTVEDDWGQIQHWQAWTVAQRDSAPEAAALCAAYPLEAGEMLDLLLTPAEHLAWREAALAAAQQTGDARAELLHRLAIGEIQTRLSDPGCDEKTIAPILSLARQLDDPDSLTHGLILMSMVVIEQARTGQTARYAEAQALLEQALELSQRNQLTRRQARCQFELGSLAFELERLADARQQVEQSLCLYQQLGDQQGTAASLRAVGAICQAERNPGQAIDYFEQSRKLFTQLRDWNSLAELSINLGLIAAELGDFAAAQQHYDTSINLNRKIGNHRGVAWSSYQRALVDCLEGHYASSAEALTDSLTIFRQHGTKRDISLTLLMLAYSHWELGAPEKLHACLLEGLSLAYQLTMTYVVSHFMLPAAAWYNAQGNAARAAVVLGVNAADWDADERIQQWIVARILQQLQTQLDPSALGAAFEHGKTLDLEATAREVLDDLQGSRV